MRVKDLIAPFSLCILLGSFPQQTPGQAVSGNIIGTVTDPSGAAIAGAQVSIANINTNATYQAATNESGNYTGANLPAGSYTVTVTKTGFQKFVQQNVTVLVSHGLPDLTINGAGGFSMGYRCNCPLHERETLWITSIPGPK